LERIYHFVSLCFKMTILSTSIVLNIRYIFLCLLFTLLYAFIVLCVYVLFLRTGYIYDFLGLHMVIGKNKM